MAGMLQVKVLHLHTHIVEYNGGIVTVLTLLVTRLKLHDLAVGQNIHALLLQIAVSQRIFCDIHVYYILSKCA